MITMTNRTTKATLEAEVGRLGALYAAEAQKVRDLTGIGDEVWNRERTIDGEQAWPLFAVTVHCERDCMPGNQATPEPWQVEGVASGRIKDRLTWHKRGFRKWPDEGELVKWSRGLWQITLKRTDKYAIVNPMDVVLTVTFVGWAVWWLSWFQHETFDVGLDDDGVLDSFQKHVNRKIAEARRAGEDIGGYLMGAEDRWRWTSVRPKGGSNDPPDPPCHCKHCKEQGMVRIVH